jgi:hypothetical protein
MPPAAVVGAPFDPFNPLRPSEDTRRQFQWAHLCTGGQNEQKALLDDGWSYTTQESVHNKFYRKAWTLSHGTVLNPLLPATDFKDRFVWVALTGAADVPRLVAQGFSYVSSKHVSGGERHGHHQLIHMYRKRRAAALPDAPDNELPIPAPVREDPAPESEEDAAVEDVNDVEPAPQRRRVAQRVADVRAAHRLRERA